MSIVRNHLGLAALAAGLFIGPGSALAADVAKGQQAFMKYGCWQCHGTVGQGSPISGPKLAPDPIPLEAMSSFIRSSNRAMPPYKEQILPNEDLADIHAYLSSVPKSPDPKGLTILND
jgi:ubiquinol-cytochrome c reductase cytochrome c subunit